MLKMQTMRHSAPGSLLLVAAMWIPGIFAQTTQPSAEPAGGQAPAPQQQVVVNPAPAAAEYLLQAGDELEIRVYNMPELTQKVKIRPDGRISVMLMDEVMAAGVRPAELGDIIHKAYATQFRNPRVTVLVTSFVNQNIFVGGEVNQPRMITMNGRMRATAAIFYAGGFKSTAKTKEIIILHNNGRNTPQLTRLNVEAVLNKGAEDVELHPFDVVFVPKSRIAKLDQFVDQYLKQLQPISLNMGFTYLLGGQSYQVVIP